MSNLKARLNTLMSRLATKGRESYQLFSACLQSSRSGGHSSIRNTLIAQARAHNQTAIQLLHADKQLSLIRYYGITNYLREHRQGSSKDGAGLTAVAGDETKKTNVARIAFMVTALQKEQLAQLGYHELDIKRLKPLEANLLLEHNVTPDQAEAKLPTLLREYEEMERQEQEKRRLQMAMEQEQQREEEGQQTIHKTASSSSHSSSSIYAVSSSRSSNEMKASRETTRTWFEVVEVAKDGDRAVIGLYTSLEEAQLGLDTLQHFAGRRSRAEDRQVTFEIRESKR